MNLIKTSLLNIVAVIIKLISSLMLNKILATYVGPAGYAVIGQFQNAVSIATSLAGGSVANGVIKSTAQHFDDQEKQHEVWKTALRFSLIASIVVGVSLLFTSKWLSSWLLLRSDMSSVFVWLALALPAMALNSLFMAIINGKKAIGVMVVANIMGSLITILVTGLLTIGFGLKGALIAFTINPALALMSTVVLASRYPWFKRMNYWGRMEQPVLKELSLYGLMGVVSALTVPVSYMAIRDHLVRELGLTAAGYWQAICGISGIYTMVVTSVLSVYYLPRVAEIRIACELKTEVLRVYAVVMPVMVSGSFIIYYLRDFIILTLFNSEFLPMRELFNWQLLGDVLKVGSWILGYILVGRSMIKSFIVLEMLFSLLFVFFVWLFVGRYGLPGAVMAYVMSYGMNWVCLACISVYEIQKMGLKHGKN